MFAAILVYNSFLKISKNVNFDKLIHNGYHKGLELSRLLNDELGEVISLEFYPTYTNKVIYHNYLTFNIKKWIMF